MPKTENARSSALSRDESAMSRQHVASNMAPTTCWVLSAECAQRRESKESPNCTERERELLKWKRKCCSNMRKCCASNMEHFSNATRLLLWRSLSNQKWLSKCDAIFVGDFDSAPESRNFLKLAYSEARSAVIRTLNWRRTRINWASRLKTITFNSCPTCRQIGGQPERVDNYFDVYHHYDELKTCVALAAWPNLNCIPTVRHNVSFTSNNLSASFKVIHIFFFISFFLRCLFFGASIIIEVFGWLMWSTGIIYADHIR